MALTRRKIGTLVTVRTPSIGVLYSSTGIYSGVQFYSIDTDTMTTSADMASTSSLISGNCIRTLPVST